MRKFGSDLHLGRAMQSGREPGRLGHGFLVLCVCNRVRNDASARVKIDAVSATDRSANKNTELAFPIKSQITEASCVRPTSDRLQFIDDFHRANLGRACDAAAGKALRERFKMADARAEPA